MVHPRQNGATHVVNGAIPLNFAVLTDFESADDLKSFIAFCLANFAKWMI